MNNQISCHKFPPYVWYVCMTVHACLNYVSYVLCFIGSYRIKKAVFPYQNSTIHEFHHDIGEVTNFKLAYEYIFVTVSLFYLIMLHLSN